MALWDVAIQKSLAAVYWLNVYHMEADTIQSCIPGAQELIAIERAVHVSDVSFVSCRISKPGKEKPSVYVTFQIGQPGLHPAVTITPLTLISRIELFKGPSRPDVKMLRMCGQAGDLQNALQWTSAWVQFMFDHYCTPLGGVEGLLYTKGKRYTTVQMAQKVGQHQLTRGTRKRTTPKIPVS